MNDCAAVSFICTECFQDIGPDLTGSTEFCDFNVEGSSRIETELDASCNIMNGQSAFQHGSDILNCHTEGICSFLNRISAASGEYIRTNENGTQIRRILCCPSDGFSHVVIVGFQRLSESACFCHLRQQVGPDNAMQIFNRFAFCFQCCCSQCNHPHGISTAVDHDRIFFQIQTIKQRAHIFQGCDAYTDIAYMLGILSIHAMHSRCIKADIIYS